jgi:hypothetical protein
MLFTCSQILRIKNKATQLLIIMDLRLLKHYLRTDIILIRRRSRRTYLHQINIQTGVQKDKDDNGILLIHIYIYICVCVP